MNYRCDNRYDNDKTCRIGIVCTMMMLVILFSGCASGGGPATEEGGKIQILCTSFPLYDWTRQVTEGCEDSMEVSLLMDQGTDPHNYQPTAEDILRISESDIIVYVGGESDLWMEDVLAAIPAERRERQQYLNMMEILNSFLREEEPIEGMQGNLGGHAYGEVDAGEEGHTDEAEYDEHIWLSVRNASVCVQTIATAVMDTDPDQNDNQTMADNAERYLAELESLDGQYEAMVSEAPLNRVLFADRFPFLYLMKDYGLEYDAAFPGCSTETEASFETVIFLAGRLEEYDLPAVLVMENGDRRMAETIIANTVDKDQEILALNSMQSVTAADIGQGVTYLSVMQENLAVLRKALDYK
ncbi:MAG: metal ABC transporter substrate-binding protein [Lachnospiraceae bacterium]|nr:metal ABC transporter substrate-binding protein [Lachnospiraceae bacterium]